MWGPGTRSYPARRAHPEADSPIRTPFQRDRDRIVHSKAFRRLKHKTQVFVAPEGDHYRTRLTHTLEACFISRTVARALGLNEDLTEAIGLGHDLGHPPFGHIGEEVLDERLGEHGRSFKHNEHSLRVVEVLEGELRGLNLTEQVSDGILRHTGPGEAGDAGGARRADRRPRRLHQPRHRRRGARGDPLRGGPAGRGDRAAGGDRAGAGRCAGARHGRALARGRRHRRSPTRWAGRCCGCGSSCSTACTSARRRGASRSGRARRCGALFAHYLDHPEEVPASDSDADDVQRVTDYLAGMTDRFCLSPERDRSALAARAGRIAGPDGLLADKHRPRAGGRGLRRGRLAVHRPEAGGAEVLRAVPVPRRADAVVLGRSGGEVLQVLRLRRRRRRLPLRRGEGGADLPRGAGGAGRALRGRDRARERGPAGRGGAAPPRPAPGAAASGPPSSTSASCGTRRRPRRRGSTCSAGACPSRHCGSSASGWRRRPGTRCWWGASGRGSR